MNGGGQRLHHLDALRALTMFLILPAHALALIGLQDGWNDLEASVFWVIHVFRLPLFFLVAGFFAALLLDSRGLAALLRNRAIRIGVPFLLGTLLAVPLLTLALRAVAEGAYRPDSSGLTATLLDIQPSYLWFLWYLTLLYAAALGARGILAGRDRVNGALRDTGAWLLSHPASPLLLALPTALLLYRQSTWMAASPPETFIPKLDLLAYYAIFFASGWLVFATPGLRDSIEHKPWRNAAIAAVALPPALVLYLLQGRPAIGEGRTFHVLALLLLSIATWSIVFGLLGASRRFLREPNPRLRYLADASYWIYLSHFVPMAAIAVVILHLEISDGPRFALLVGATLALIYPAYGAFVRHTTIGRVLHGPRPRARPLAAPLATRRATAAARRA